MSRGIRHETQEQEAELEADDRARGGSTAKNR